MGCTHINLCDVESLTVTLRVRAVAVQQLVKSSLPIPMVRFATRNPLTVSAADAIQFDATAAVASCKNDSTLVFTCVR